VLEFIETAASITWFDQVEQQAWLAGSTVPAVSMTFANRRGGLHDGKAGRVHSGTCQRFAMAASQFSCLGVI
jgi:hypothetical protein